jgi:hypothetical protein
MGNGHDSAGSPASLATTGIVGMLLQTLLAERTSFASGDSQELAALKELTSRMTRQTLSNVSSPQPAAAAKEIATSN